MKLTTTISFALVLGGCAVPRADRSSPSQKADPAPLSITVTQLESDSWLRNLFAVSIRNTGKDDVTILKPLDGSDYSLHLPFYRFIVKDQNGTMLSMGSRCGISGLWADTKWPDDYLLVLRSGEEFKKTFPLCFVVPEDGEYELRFEYVMDLKTYPRKGKLRRYPEQVWKGAVSSETKTFKLRKQDI